MKKNFVLTMLAILCFPLALCAQTDAQRAEAFIQESKRLPVAERIQRALAALETSDDDSVVGAAARDLARFSNTSEQAERSLLALNTLIEGKSADSTAYRMGTLAKARVLARLGRTDEAKAIFQQAIRQCWPQDVFGEMNETFMETDNHSLLAVMEYERCTGDNYTPEMRERYPMNCDFLNVFCHLRRMHVARPKCVAMEEVFPQMSDSANRPLGKPFAKVFCLAADERWREAILELNKIQSQLASGDVPAGLYDESEDIPLYYAALLFFEGRDFEGVRTSFQRYMDLHRDDPKRVMEKAVALVYAMDETQDDVKRVAELTTMVVNSRWFVDPNLRKQIPDATRAILLVMHCHSLVWRGQHEDAATMAQQIMEEFYPQTLQGANAAGYYAVYLWQRMGNRQQAEELFNDILQNAPYDGIVPQVKIYLARIAAERGDYRQAMALLEDVLARCGEDSVGDMRVYRECALGLRDGIKMGDLDYCRPYNQGGQAR